MSGLTSLGQLLTVNSLTPSTCAVNSNALWDRSGGILNRTIVTGLANGACSLKFDFSGSAAWLPTTLTWNATVSSIAVPTGTSITIQAISGNVVAGKEVVGEMSATAPAMFLSGLDRGRVQMDLAVIPTNPAATIGLDAQRRYNPLPSGSLMARILTPTTCRFESTTATSARVINNRVMLLPRAVGTCSVAFEFTGISAWRAEPSTRTWSATVSQ